MRLDKNKGAWTGKRGLFEKNSNGSGDDRERRVLQCGDYDVVQDLTLKNKVLGSDCEESWGCFYRLKKSI